MNPDLRCVISAVRLKEDAAGESKIYITGTVLHYKENKTKNYKTS